MKRPALKKDVAFIIALVMFSIMPALMNSQKICPDGHCPKGQTCVNGFCVKSGGKGGNGGGTICNCFVRPIPFECGQICGWIIPANKSLSISSANSNAISFQLMQAQNVSARIYDATGRLVRTLAQKVFEEGDHKLEWNAADLQTGIYLVKVETAGFSGIKRLAVSR